MLNIVRHLATSVALAAALPSGAVYLDGGGLGQALLYPYYTVQSTDSNAFNTYVSIANTAQAKAVKVRFREGRNSRLVLEFNLYLARGDMWTGAIVPTGAGARLITRDASCTDPPIPDEGVDFTSSSYAGGDDLAGTGLDRTREGHFEVIEMGTLSEVAAGFARINDQGLAMNCDTLRGTTNSQLAPPTGGLTGTGTLINVNNGLDGTYVADALASLAAAPMYSPPGEPGTDFDSPQVSPISHFTVDNVAYRMVWSRGIDAVSSVLVAELFENEFVLDSGTASKTDWVITLPTKRFYVTTSSAQLPFLAPFGPSPYLCEGMSGSVFDREGRAPDSGISFPVPPPSGIRSCWSATAFSIRAAENDAQPSPSDVFGSRNTLGWEASFIPIPWMINYTVPPGIANGRISLGFDGSVMTSQASSTAMDLATGTVTAGSRYLAGYPAIGFIARTFTNGTLACAGSACQGNYASLLPHRRIRRVHLPP